MSCIDPNNKFSFSRAVYALLQGDIIPAHNGSVHLAVCESCYEDALADYSNHAEACRADPNKKVANIASAELFLVALAHSLNKHLSEQIKKGNTDFSSEVVNISLEDEKSGKKGEAEKRGSGKKGKREKKGKPFFTLPGKEGKK